MTSYSTRVVNRDGNKRLEIWADGMPWGERSDGRSRFQLSVREAEAVLLAMKYLEDFVESGGLEPTSEVTWLPKTVPAFERQKVWITRHADFDRSGGVINDPYLSIRCGRSKKGFGLEKANALVALEAAITRFVRRTKAASA